MISSTMAVGNQARSSRRSRLQTHANMRFANGNAETSKRIRSPPLAFESNRSVQKPDFSPEEVQRLGSRRKSPINYDEFPPQLSNHQVVSYSDAHDSGTLSPPKPSFRNGTKRARSPVPFADDLATSSTQFDSKREMQAKVKRLARFNVELSQPIHLHDLVKSKPSGNKENQASLDKCNADEHIELARDLSSSEDLFDTEGQESSQVVVGLCPYMCPESERKERERKGQLDRYERLDGERNQTTKFLAVKKYNRTAEREADMIRPMPVLQKTVDYLLSLLDQPYNDNFLSIYNFLWDRMRAIRMDLRMQHIFNQQAIIMLEQMIRLHIIAMHELCEFKRGEGFSEGFDAHLNIEQMNKTSVELFQMYDDQRKKGINVPTEKEFRGYYALLKLDKHPGYKVGPAELSFDLAKMILEIRCTPEILFARDVARACRIGNYITFFRLARKATYLQACLMHAHFAKIRMQALASLHKGLQENKGIPIAHIVDWLGMEEEDVEGLLEYHGFVSKKYEEMYMVKEGPFLNGGVDFPTKCARLVHLKKSKRIIDDVCSDPKNSDLSEETEVASDVPDSMFQRTESSKTEDWVNIGKEEVRDYKSDNDPRAVAQTEQPLEGPVPGTVVEENDAKMTEVFPVFASCATEDDSVHNNEDEQITELDGDTSMGQGILPQMETTIVQVGVARFSNSKFIVENTAPRTEVASDVADSILQRTESSKIEDWVNTGNEEVYDYKSDNDLRAVIQTEQLLEGPLPATVIKKNDAKMTEVFSPFASCATENGSVHNDEDEQMTELDGDTSMGQGILPQMETTIVQAGVARFSNSKLIFENTAPQTEVASDVADSILQRIESSKTEDWVNSGNEEVCDYKSNDLRAVIQTEQLLEEPLPATVIEKNDTKMTEVFSPFVSCATENGSVHNDEDEQMTELDGDTSVGQGILPQMETTVVQAGVPRFSNSKLVVENTAPQTEVGKSLENEASKIILCRNEVASEKLKLVERTWKPTACLQRKNRGQREFLRSSALSSLSIGIPLRPIQGPPRHASSKLDFDYVARVRYARHEKSWSTVNVSDLVAPILSAKHPNARCLCWKLVVCVQRTVTMGQTNLMASRWLLSKLMGSGKENELIVSSSHLSIWKKWINRNSSSEACCLSVIREAMFVHRQQVAEDDTFAGASCIIFLVSESIPWEIQRIRLQNLLMSVPSGSSLPLLLVVGDAYKEETADPSATIIKRLGLHDADKTRVNLFRVVFAQEHFNGFFDDDKLREGLRWLANCSPLQPSPLLMDTHELVLSYLRRSLMLLDNYNASEIGPDCCILAFNKALDQLVEEILTAVSMNPICWPCPEVDLLEKSSRERMIADMFLPSIGWSSPARTEQLIRAIKGCKLPKFSYDLSFLSQGSHMGSQIPNQKLAFEKCLIKYLAQSCRLLDWNLATMEAGVMVQNGAGLELRGSCYYIIPRWFTIFRRIYNWRLLNLRSGEASVAYVLDPSITDSLCKMDAEMLMKSDTGMQYFESRFSSEWQQPLHYVPNEVPFDELFEVSRRAFVEQPSSVHMPECSPPGVTLEDGCAFETDAESRKTDGDFRVRNFASDYSLEKRDASKQKAAASLSVNNDKFTMLLAQCKRLQDMIDEKLAICF